MQIRRKYTPIYKNATALLRPKTGLNDMLIELDAGLEERRASCRRASTSRSTRRCRTSTLDEILAGLDGDTRDYLRLLIAGAGEGLKGNAEQPRRRRSSASSPTGARPAEDHQAARRAARQHPPLDPQLQPAEPGARPQGPGHRAAGRLLERGLQGRSPSQDANLREALQPAAAARCGDEHGAGQGQPPRPRPRARRSARCCPAPARSGRRWWRRGRSCARRRRSSRTSCARSRVDAQPTVKLLRPAAADLAKATPKLTTSLDVVN